MISLSPTNKWTDWSELFKLVVASFNHQLSLINKFTTSFNNHLMWAVWTDSSTSSEKLTVTQHVVPEMPTKICTSKTGELQTTLTVIDRPLICIICFLPRPLLPITWSRNSRVKKIPALYWTLVYSAWNKITKRNNYFFYYPMGLWMFVGLICPQQSSLLSLLNKW